VRTALRFLSCLAIAFSLSVAALPAKPLPPVEKTDCCAKIKAEAASHDCDRHAPKPDPDKQCCSVCTLCLAGVLTAATPFVYPSGGDETFAAYISSEHSCLQQPPVPPPRA
jgi:hypothetical protein